MEKKMKVENGKIIEITEQELYRRYIDKRVQISIENLKKAVDTGKRV